MKTLITTVAMTISMLALPAFASHAIDPLRASNDLVHAAAGLDRSLDRHGARRYLDWQSDSMLREALFTVARTRAQSRASFTGSRTATGTCA